MSKNEKFKPDKTCEMLSEMIKKKTHVESKRKKKKEILESRGGHDKAGPERRVKKKTQEIVLIVSINKKAWEQKERSQSEPTASPETHNRFTTRKMVQ